MAIDFLSIGSVGDTTARSAYSCLITRSPAIGRLALVGVQNTSTAANVAGPTGVVGAGITFSLVTSGISYDPVTAGSQTRMLSLWRGMVSTLDASLVTVTFSGNQTGCAILVDEASGVSQAGANGSSAVSGSAVSIVGGVSAITAFFPSVSSTANAWYSIQGADTFSGQQTPGDAWQSLASVGYQTPLAQIASGYTLLASATSVRWASGSVLQRGVIAVEVVADNPGSANAAQWVQGFGVSGPRIFQPRVRGDLWVEPGHAVNTDPATDTREG